MNVTSRKKNNDMRLPVYCILATVALLVIAACSSGGRAEPTQAPDSESSAAQAPNETPTPQPAALIEWGDEDCIFRPSGELGELTRVTRTYVENDPKLNIERIFLRFTQSESVSTILRCDMNTAGLFSTWWVQSFATEEEAKELFETLVLVTGPEVDELNDNPLSCALIRAGREGSDSYQLDFVDKGLCDADVFNGRSAAVHYGTTVIGIDSQFHEEFFDPLLDHAKAVVDKRSSS